MKKIPLTQGKYAIVDDEDFTFLNRLSWLYQKCIKKSGCISEGANNPLTNMDMAFFLVNKRNDQKLCEVVHINHNGLDYRKDNLKLMTLAEVRNWKLKRKNTKSIYKGLWQHKETGLWYAEITKEKKRYRSTCFKTEIEACKWYNQKSLELYGQHAYQNKIV